MKKGFTLLEMIVVVMIISVLFLLTVPNVSKVMNSVDSRACYAQCKVVDAAIVQFRLDFDELPHSIQDLISGGYILKEQATCRNGINLKIVDGHAVQE